MDAKKLKLIVKGEKKPTFGTDPNEPWSARVGITESERGELHAYLKSRGINPDFVSKDTKISHAKSSEFHKWRRDHQFDDPINFVSTTVADKMKTQRAQTEEVEQIDEKNVPTSPEKWARAKAAAKSKFAVYPSAYANGWASKKYKAMGGGWKSVSEESEQLDELAPETLASYVLKTSGKDPKRAEPRKKAMSKLAKTMAKRPADPNAPKYSSNIFGEAKTIQGTALDKFRQAAAERARKHDDIEREMKARHAAGKEDMKGSIDRLEKQLNKEETINEVSSSEVEHHFHNWTNSEHAPYNSDAGDDNKVHQSALRYLRSTNVPKQNHEKLAMHIAHKFHGSGIDESAGISKTKETTFHKKLDKLVHGTFGKRKDEMKMKEEVEQIDELKKSTVKSWLGQQPVVPPKKPGMDRKAHNQRIKTRSKSWDSAIDRLTGRKPTSEDVFQDTQAATQTAFDMGTQADDREPTYSKRKEMSKSARMIKALYKKHKMVKEELYDHEKEDKSVATYGKKPKVEKQEVYGDDDTQAAMVLKGGKTLTGQTRDTLEIDPVMRKPVKPDSKEKT